MTEYKVVMEGDNIDKSAVQVGDRVTAVVDSGSASEYTMIATVLEDSAGDLRLGPYNFPNWIIRVTHVERPLPEVVEEIGAVYGDPTLGSYARVTCVTPGSWLASYAAVKRVDAESGDSRWLRTEQVKTLVRNCGYVRLDKREE